MFFIDFDPFLFFLMGFDCFEHDGGRCGWGTVWMGTALNKFDLIGCVFYWAGTAPGGTAWGTAFPNIRTVWSEVSTAYDLTDRRVIFKIREDIRRGRIVAVMLAPPCSSFSPARDRTSVIRTRSSPWGLPGLSEKDQQKVEQGNSCIKAALEIIGDLNKYTIPWILENPHCSKMWFLPPLQKLVNDASVHVRVCDFCQFGTKWRKRTRFLIGNCDETDSLRLQRTCQAKNGHCSRSGKKHFHLTGSNNKGTPWTLIAQPYPSRLCHSLAHTLLSQAIEQRTH